MPEHHPADLISTLSKMGAPRPAGRPVTQHSTTPPMGNPLPPDLFDKGHPARRPPGSGRGSPLSKRLGALGQSGRTGSRGCRFTPPTDSSRAWTWMPGVPAAAWQCLPPRLGGCEPGGGISAAPGRRCSPMADEIGVVPWPGRGGSGFSDTPPTGCRRFQRQRRGGAAGDPIYQAGQDVGDVPLLALGGIPSPGRGGRGRLPVPQVDGFTSWQGNR